MPGDLQRDMEKAFGIISSKVIPTGKYDVHRPDYTSPTTSDSVIQTGASMMVNLASGGSEPSMGGAPTYHIGYDNTYFRLRSGDILFPTAGEAPTGSTRVIVTVESTDDNKPICAFRSNRIGSICDSKKTVLFTNVHFDFYGSPGPEEPLNPDMPGSSYRRTAKAAVYFRANMRPSYKLIDTLTGIIYPIRQINGTGPIMLLDLHQGEQ